MKPVFLINEMLLFEPEERRLCLLADYPRHAVVLHTPVSECLYQLLEHNGEVLSQRFLFEAVWGKNGAIVTTNALYQCIASIRKGLRAAGFNDDIIKTLPKTGFKSVARLHKGVPEEFIQPLTVMVSTDPAPVFTPEADIATVKSDNTALKAFFSSRIAYIVAAIFFCLSCSVLFLTSKTEESVFAEYKHIGKIGECDVWSSWYNVDKSRSLFVSLSDHYPVHCEAGDIAYMTVNRLQQGTSVIVCNQNPEKSNTQCRSLFYRQKYHEN